MKNIVFLISFLLYLFFFFNCGLRAQWVQSNGPIGGSLAPIAVSNNNLYAGSTDNGIYLSIDNGNNWTQIAKSLVNYAYIKSLAVKGDTIFAGSLGNYPGDPHEGVFWSTNNGINWTHLDNLPSIDIWSLAIIGSNIFAGTISGFFRSTDNGVNWSFGGLSSLEVNAFTFEGNKIYVCTENGIYRSTDNGITFTSIGLTGLFVRGVFVYGNNIFAGAGGSVYHSTNDGATWSQTSLTNQYVYTFILSGTNIVAGTSSGMFYSSNSGSDWAQSSGSPASGSMIVKGDTIFAGTASNGLCISTDHGEHWAQINTGIANTSVPVMGVCGINVFATVSSGIYRSTDSGISWNRIYVGVPSNLAGVFSVFGTKIYTITNNGVYFSTDDGINWTYIGLSNNLYSLAVKEDTIFVGTWPSGVYRSINNGINWTQVNGGLPFDPYSATFTISNLIVFGNNIFASLDYGPIYRSTNNGTYWTSEIGILVNAFTVCGTKLFAGSGNGVFFTSENDNGWTKVNNGLADTAISSLTSSGTNIFASTFSGKVFLSTNYGTDWTEVDNGLPGVDILSMTTNSSYVFAGTYDRGVWKRPLSELISLPVELTSFTSNVNLNSINLAWKTATELNNTGFEIERKLNNGIFSKIAFISGSGTTSETHSYSYSDRNLTNGKYCYRLKQIDNDGKETFSNIIEAEVNMPEKFSLNQNYPNPFNPNTIIQYSIAKEGKVKLTVFNAVGSKVATIVDEVKPAGNYLVQFNGSNLASGIYLYRLEAGNYSATKKLILLK